MALWLFCTASREGSGRLRKRVEADSAAPQALKKTFRSKLISRFVALDFRAMTHPRFAISPLCSSDVPAERAVYLEPIAVR